MRIGIAVGASSVLLLIGGCASVPRPELPQVEQAREAAHGGGERLRAHQHCVGTARTIDDLVACMQREGYVFIDRRPAYPSPQCWAARTEGSAPANILPHCFEHAAGTTH